jgi:hypothetical protein
MKKWKRQRLLALSARKPVPGFVPGLKRPEVIEKVLTASNEFWSHSCVWKRRDGIWFCESGSGPLIQLKGLNEQQAKVALIRMGCSWTWG